MQVTYVNKKQKGRKININILRIPGQNSASEAKQIRRKEQIQIYMEWHFIKRYKILEYTHTHTHI